jgi:hypothetical protein
VFRSIITSVDDKSVIILKLGRHRGISQIKNPSLNISKEMWKIADTGTKIS